MSTFYFISNYVKNMGLHQHEIFLQILYLLYHVIYIFIYLEITYDYYYLQFSIIYCEKFFVFYY
jgi:hypothetical protein